MPIDPAWISSPLEVLLSLLTVLVLLGVFSLVVVLICLNFGSIGAHWKAGLGLGGVVLLLTLPASLASIVYLDADALVQQLGGSPNRQFMRAMIYVGVVVGMCFVAAKVGWHMLIYVAGVAEWNRHSGGGYAVLDRRERRWRAVLGAGLFGLAAAALTLLLFDVIGVSESQAVRQWQQLFRGMTDMNPLLQVAVATTAMSSAAIAEELTFRGLLLPFFLRFARGRWGVVVAVTAVSLLWALMHLPNTDAPGVKLLQIFVIGLVLGEFARRSSMLAAMAGHVALNVGATWLSML